MMDFSIPLDVKVSAKASSGTTRVAVVDRLKQLHGDDSVEAQKERDWLLEVLSKLPVENLV